MNCCAGHVSAAQRCFGILSKLYARRYRRKGLDDTQRILVEQLARCGFDGQTLLEVGCGVGEVHQTLLERGAASALGIDLADRMLDHARERAEGRGLTDRVEYRLGDFVDLQDSVEMADITVLDKVVCCYPAPKALLDAAADHTRRIVALTYPRKHLLSKFSNRVWNALFWLLRSDFRSFVHDPIAVRGWLEERGLRQVFNYDTLMWHTELYEVAEIYEVG